MRPVRQTRHLAFDYAEMNESGPSPVAALPRSLNMDKPGAADLLSWRLAFHSGMDTQWSSDRPGRSSIRVARARSRVSSRWCDSARSASGCKTCGVLLVDPPRYYSLRGESMHVAWNTT